MRMLVVAMAGGLALTTANVSREQADSFQRKLGQIVQNGESASDRERRTLVTEGEVNSYLRYKAGDQIPVGVTEPTIGIQPEGRLNGRAIVDLDVIRPLSEFARARRLSSRDVEKLLGVARAMFNGQ